MSKLSLFRRCDIYLEGRRYGLAGSSRCMVPMCREEWENGSICLCLVPEDCIVSSSMISFECLQSVWGAPRQTPIF